MASGRPNGGAHRATLRTDELPQGLEGARRERFRELVTELYGPLELAFPTDEPFGARLELARFGAVGAAELADEPAVAAQRALLETAGAPPSGPSSATERTSWTAMARRQYLSGPPPGPAAASAGATARAMNR